MKNLFVVLSPIVGDQLSVGADYALALAHAQGAHLSVLIEEIEPSAVDPLPEPNNMQVEATVSEPSSIAERLARTVERRPNSQQELIIRGS
jgi:hypothetical protein